MPVEVVGNDPCGGAGTQRSSRSIDPWVLMNDDHGSTRRGAVLLVLPPAGDGASGFTSLPTVFMASGVFVVVENAATPWTPEADPAVVTTDVVAPLSSVLAGIATFGVLAEVLGSSTTTLLLVAFLPIFVFPMKD